MKKCQHLTGGFAQAGQCLAGKFVQILTFCARPSDSESPACAKPLGRYPSCGERSTDNERNIVENFMRKYYIHIRKNQYLCKLYQ
jgi:hypothetical protein